MSNNLPNKQQANLPANPEANAIAEEAMQDAGFQKMIKFKRIGDSSGYICDDKQLAIGTQMIAHCIGWTKTWVNFEDKQVKERHVYRVSHRERAPDRETWGNGNPANWPIGIDGKPADPWVLQYLLPMEAMGDDSGELRIFVASSFGGKRAVADLCSSYARRAQRNPGTGQPIISLDKMLMPTKNFGDVPRPYFKIIGWDDGHREAVREVSTEKLRQGDFDDEIPF
jgi:hypothetical protein